MSVLLLIAGLALLITGAEVLVRGASRLAAVLRIPPLIIGLTVVAFGTSSPELAVGLRAALSGQADVAVGNVMGSNIFNILFILGLSAMIVPLAVSRQLVRFDVPLMIVLSVLALVLGLDGIYSRSEGVLLFLGLAAYIGSLIRRSSKESQQVKDAYAKPYAAGAGASKRWIGNIAFVLGGLALLAIGSSWLIESALSIARHLGVSELIIGLTVVAAGTSMPEMVTSVVASIRGARDIAVGNVVGSNLFNIMGVLGIASIAAPAGVAVSNAVLRFDLPIMVATAFACLPIFFTDGMISRKEGILLFGYYAAYTVYLLLAAAHHDALPLFSLAILAFAVPLTLVTLGVLAIQSIKTGRSAAMT